MLCLNFGAFLRQLGNRFEIVRSAVQINIISNEESVCTDPASPTVQIPAQKASFST